MATPATPPAAPRITLVDHGVVSYITLAVALLVSSDAGRYPSDMGERIEQQKIDRSRNARKRPAKQTPELSGRRLLQIVVYGKRCRIGGRLTLDDLAESSEIGDWKMPDFKAACTYAVSQGWLSVDDDTLTLTTAGLAAA